MEKNYNILDQIKPSKPEGPSVDQLKSIASKIHAEQVRSHEPNKKKIRRVVYLTLSAAAAAVVLYLTIIPSTPEEDRLDLLAELNKLPSQEVTKYVDDHIDEFELEMIAEHVALENDEIDTLRAQDEVHPIKTETEILNSLDQLKPEDIRRYLLDQGIETEDLENEDFI